MVQNVVKTCYNSYNNNEAGSWIGKTVNFTKMCLYSEVKLCTNYRFVGTDQATPLCKGCPLMGVSLH